MVNLVPSEGRSGRETGVATRRDNPLFELRRRMDDLFENFFGRLSGMGQSEELRVWDFDVSERENEVVVRAELPGFEADEINVQVSNEILSIKAEKREKKDGRESIRSFQRMVTLPSGTRESDIEATYHSGVLELVLPREEKAQPKRIPIRCESGATGQSQLGQPQAVGEPRAEKTSQSRPEGISPPSESEKEIPPPKAGSGR